MTEETSRPLGEPAPANTNKVDPETLVLRARPARAIRFKRGVIVTGAAIVAAGVVGTAWFALEPHSIRLVASSDDGPVAAKTPTDALSRLPTTYGTAPKLGPPLPGDLGRPILDRQRELSGLPVPPATVGPVPDVQRKADDLKAARQSGLLVQRTDRNGEAAPSSTVMGAADPASKPDSAGPSPAPERDPNGQRRKADFAALGDKDSDVNPNQIVASPSLYSLSAGTVIAASLITGLRSDVPGLVIAQVTQRVYDSASGRTLLVPQGARLIGKYDSVIAFGQRRALVVWQRLMFPDGSSIRLDNAPATDAAGYAGLEDRVDFHTWALLKGVVMSTLLGVGAELQFSGGSDLVQALRQSTQQNVSRAGDQLTSRNLQVQPTITIRPGYPVRLVVNQDLVLKPWLGEH